MNNKGQSLFELVIAIGISALIMVGVVSLALNAIQNAKYSKDKSRAATYAQQASEWLRGQRDADISIFVSTRAPTSGSTNYYCLQNLSWDNTGSCVSTEYISGTTFLRELKLTTTTVSSKLQIEADITVSWTDSKGTHIVTNATNFSDWRQR